MIVITLIVALGAVAFATVTGAMFGPPDRSEYFRGTSGSTPPSGSWSVPPRYADEVRQMLRASGWPWSAA